MSYKITETPSGKMDRHIIIDDVVDIGIVFDDDDDLVLSVGEDQVYLSLDDAKAVLTCLQKSVNEMEADQ